MNEKTIIRVYLRMGYHLTRIIDVGYDDTQKIGCRCKPEKIEEIGALIKEHELRLPRLSVEIVTPNGRQECAMDNDWASSLTQLPELEHLKNLAQGNALGAYIGSMLGIDTK